MSRARGQTMSKEERLLGLDTCREMEALDQTALKDLVVQASDAIRTAKAELEGNDKYQELKASLRALSGAYSDLRKRQNGKIQYALKLMENKGE